MRKDGNYRAGFVRESPRAIGLPRGACIRSSLLALITPLTQPALAQQLVTYSGPTPDWPFGPTTPTLLTSGGGVLVIWPMPGPKLISLPVLRENRLLGAMRSNVEHLQFAEGRSL
jgi:hypothetical protein